MTPIGERVASLETNHNNSMSLLKELKEMLLSHFSQESVDKEELKKELKEHIDSLAKNFVHKNEFESFKKHMQEVKDKTKEESIKENEWAEKPYTKAFYERGIGFIIIGAIILVSGNALWDLCKFVFHINL